MLSIDTRNHLAQDVFGLGVEHARGQAFLDQRLDAPDLRRMGVLVTPQKIANVVFGINIGAIRNAGFDPLLELGRKRDVDVNHDLTINLHAAIANATLTSPPS
ncbi:MAG: hypothetical protein ACTHM0_15245 [Sphingomonas sp.]